MGVDGNEDRLKMFATGSRAEVVCGPSEDVSSVTTSR